MRTSRSIQFHPPSGSTRGLLLAVAGFAVTTLPLLANKPEIDVQQPFGSSLKDGASRRDFGVIPVGQTSTSRIFKIKNRGYADLTGLRIAKSGANVSDFIVGPLKGESKLGPGDTAIFKVQFKPGSKGIRTANLRIFSNDANENPFDVKLTGEGVGRGTTP